MDRTIAVRFDANVMSEPELDVCTKNAEIRVKLGETTTVHYKITNKGKTPTTGIATYNVQPDLAGSYFSKLECFCFTEQTLKPGETLGIRRRFLCRSAHRRGYRHQGHGLHHPFRTPTSRPGAESPVAEAPSTTTPPIVQ